MKLKSNVWKDRTIHLPGASNTKFDENGICDIDIDENQAEYLVKNIKELSIVDKTAKVTPKKTEPVVPKATPATKEDGDALAKEDEAKKAAILKIKNMKSLKKLKDLASSFDKVEWTNLTTADQLKEFLIGKI